MFIYVMNIPNLINVANFKFSITFKGILLKYGSFDFELKGRN